MAVSLPIIGLGLLAALLPAALPGRWRQTALLLASLVALFWLQPPLPLRWSGFLLPLLTLSLTAGCWWLSRPEEKMKPAREDWLTLAVMGGAVLGLSLVRYLPFDWRPTLNRPPDTLLVFALLLVLGAAFWSWTRTNSRRLLLGAGVILVFFVVLKSDPLAAAASRLWRALSSGEASLAAAGDLSWLGYSYIAFRLLHTLRDRATGQLPHLSLSEYASYVLFFPALIAGPIARVERFAADWRLLPDRPAAEPGRWFAGFSRIGSGLFKKFILADSLALGLALEPAMGDAILSSGWLWLLLYGYALRLYLDFAGYTDIAIGLGLLAGVRLPENFRRPYLQRDLASFWQSWHISLSDWARFYIFTPLSRALLRRKPRPPAPLIVLTGHLATMLAIGLWHGITLNFAIWGMWHAAGLFIHKQWSDRTRRRYRQVQAIPWQRRVWGAAGWFLTFHFVVLGWVWFLMPDPQGALLVFGRLFAGGAP